MNALTAVPLSVLSTLWLDEENGPVLEVALSNGRFLKIGWDVSYCHPIVFVAADETAPYESCVARETGLGDEIEPLIDQARDAALHHEAERERFSEDDFRADEERPS